MKNLREIIGNNFIKHVENREGKQYEFYAFVGYAPIIKELMQSNCHNGDVGCFRFMFIEKNKPKIVCIIRNKEEIETVSFLINDSWIIGNSIPSTNEYLGNLGFYTRQKYRGNGNANKICKFFEETFSKITNITGYRVHIQYHVKEQLSKNFKLLKVDTLRYGENSGSWIIDDIKTKHPYSIDFKKETNKIMKNMWT